MTTDYGVGVDARSDQWVPGSGVDRRHVEGCGILREGHGVTTLGCEPTDFGSGFFNVPQREDPSRDEPTGMSGAPFIDVPIVVRLDHYFIDRAVRTLVENLS